jgi:sulfur-oxidizing protein SoxY
MERRKFLGLGAGFLAAAVIPSTMSAQNWRETNKVAFDAKNVNDAMNGLFGTTSATESSKIKLKAPDIAENGAVIPVSVKAPAGTKTIAVFQSANPESATAVFDVPARGIPEYSIRIKMSKTGDVVAVAKMADGSMIKASKQVKVTIGGCGG